MSLSESQSHDEWWGELTDDRKAQIRRWLSKPEENQDRQIPGQIPLIPTGEEE